MLLLVGVLLDQNKAIVYYHWVDTIAGGLLVPEGIIRTGVTTIVYYIYLCLTCTVLKLFNL